jgi:transcriptional regulator with XRE-family HTH domain
VPRSKPDPALAATVRRLREGQGITREALALEAGITTGSLARLELGYGSPSWDTLGRVAGALGMSVSDLAGVIEIAHEAQKA